MLSFRKGLDFKIATLVYRSLSGMAPSSKKLRIESYIYLLPFSELQTDRQTDRHTIFYRLGLHKIYNAHNVCQLAESEETV